MSRTDRLRVAAALAASLLAHLLLFWSLRRPPPAPLAPAGARLNLLLIPVPGERRAASAETLPAAAPAPAPEGSRPAVRERKPQEPRPGIAEPARGRQAMVSAGPITPPPGAPASRLPDAAAYLAPQAIVAHPEFAAPFEMHFPRRALEEGRRGVVIVQVLIDEDGRVAEALAFPGAAEDFTEAALAGLRAARFRPAQAGGGPVKARAYFAVSFVIE